MSTVHDARLIPAALVAWCAALIFTEGWRLPDGAPPWLLGVGVLVAVIGRSSRAVTMAGLLGVVAGGVGLVATTQAAVDAAAGAALVAAGDTEAWITITDESTPMTGWGEAERHRAEATVDAWRPPCREPPACEGWLASKAPVMVVLDSAPARGERLLVEAAWDTSDRGPATAVAWDAHVVDGAPFTALVRWRAAFSAATAGLDDGSRGLVRGMIVGDTSSMPPAQEEAMRVSGLAHLTAVSGAHFAILIMAAGAVTAAVRAPPLVRAGVILVVALTFAALVGAESSVLRALGMAVAVSLATAWGRPARGLAALAGTVTVLLVLEPALSRALGFAMSVLAVAAIVLWSPRIAAVLAHVVTPALARVAAIPLAAQAAVTPVLVVIEPRLGPYAVVANLVAGLAVLPTMLAGALTLVLAVVSPAAAEVAAHVAGACASAIALVARAAASAPGAELSWPPGAIGVVGAAGIGVLLIAATVAEHPSRRVSAFVGALAIMGAGLSLAAGAERPVMVGWDVAACDVGQGDMLLLRSAPGTAIVIDTGPPGGEAAACLASHGISHVPLLILTHPHQDHDGAVVSVLGQASVDSAWLAASGAGGPAALALTGAGVPVEVPEPGRSGRWGDVELTVVSGAHERADVDGNDASVVIHAIAGETSVLALGDLEQPGQRELMSRLPPGLTVDVVKVAHHGSADQLPELAATIDAPVALFSAGRDNRHGHPTDQALSLYGEYAQAVLRTDVCGHLHVGTVDGALVWSRCPMDVAR